MTSLLQSSWSSTDLEVTSSQLLFAVATDSEHGLRNGVEGAPDRFVRSDVLGRVEAGKTEDIQIIETWPDLSKVPRPWSCQISFVLGTKDNKYCRPSK